MMRTQIELEVVDLPGGGMIVIGGVVDPAKIAAALREDMADLDVKSDKKAVEQIARRLDVESEAMRRRFPGQTRKIQFSMRAYTYGERLNAERLATTRDVDGNQVFDSDSFQIELLRRCVEPIESIEDLPTALVRALVAHMTVLSEPTAEALHFFDLGPMPSAPVLSNQEDHGPSS